MEGGRMYTVDLYLRVRLACHVDGLSQREAASRFGIARETVRKMLRHSEPPGYRRRQPPKRPKLAPFTDIIDRILEEDRTVHRKQHHTAKRIFERLRDEHGFTGKETIVKDYVRERRLRRREMFVPLSHPPGHAQADFGEADAIIASVKYRAHFFVMTLPHSDACFVAAYPAATTEAWLDGHNRAFVFFAGVPQSILYDNDKCLVSRILTDTPQVLLAHHLKTLKLPTFLREYDKLARQCATEGADHVRYLVRLTELELIDRERRMVERRIRPARFPAVKSLDSFDFKAIASLNKMLVLELARCEYVERRENIIALGNSGTGKTHIALGLGLAACQKGLSVGFLTAAALVHELMEARDEKRLLRLQKQLAKYHLLIIDELGFVPLSKTGAELLFEVFSQRYERGSILVTSNLPFDEWTEIFGSERLTGALLDRLTHHVHILEMNGESYRLNQSQKRRKSPKIPA